MTFSTAAPNMTLLATSGHKFHDKTFENAVSNDCGSNFSVIVQLRIITFYNVFRHNVPHKCAGFDVTVYYLTSAKIIPLVYVVPATHLLFYRKSPKFPCLVCHTLGPSSECNTRNPKLRIFKLRSIRFALPQQFGWVLVEQNQTGASTLTRDKAY